MADNVYVQTPVIIMPKWVHLHYLEKSIITFYRVMCFCVQIVEFSCRMRPPHEKGFVKKKLNSKGFFIAA